MSLKRHRASGRAWLPAFALLLISAPGHATSVRPMNIVDLLTYSNTIVAGQVEKVTDGFDAKGLPYTEVTLRVTDTVRGQKAETLTFRQFGLDKPRTMPDGRVFLGGRPTGWPTWRRNEAALVFLYPEASQTGMRTTVGLGYGKLRLGNGVALNAYDNAGMFQGVKVNDALLDVEERAMFEKERGPVRADTLRKFLHRAVEGRWVQAGSLRHAAK